MWRTFNSIKNYRVFYETVLFGASCYINYFFISMQYVKSRSSTLFFKFDFDGKFYEYGPLNFETNVSNGIQEWSDETVDLNSPLVQYFKNAKSVKYRLEGRQFYRDYKMSPEKLKKIQNTIKLYEFMK